MGKPRFFIFVLVLVLMSGCGNINMNHANSSLPEIEKSNEAVEKILTEDLSKYFTGYDGCFVLFDKNKGQYIIYNEQKSKKQVPPCSTFKIVNSLIGLETNVLQDENTVFKWDGTKYSISEWNKDQTLETAVSNSVVWYFQQVASKIGEERMQSYLNEINYGNRDISGGITKFWLQSSLKISPIEQIHMLRNLYDYKLPFATRNVDVVKKVLVLSNQEGAVLSGKTGSGVAENKGVNGWFVGYVERDNDVFFFAANIESDNHASGVQAKEITMQILKDKNIL
ncbi:class D beta-lactamase [Geosporobacter ferrireducens]|uniref:class D beta-lactamase n=1 Tax=Geosporobacter ferrireducens TaxID=1424294 RepID=UPI00139ED613|nr:class D beta-lactamase [Geosporobacter ferrireducens]MTI57815.1 class D beta-lactamase [Geosporobacter ferrireducens]